MNSSNSGGNETERITRRAYEIWVSEGRPQNRAVAHWVQAEAEIRAQFPAATAKQEAADSVPAPVSTPLSPTSNPKPARDSSARSGKGRAAANA